MCQILSFYCPNKLTLELSTSLHNMEQTSIPSNNDDLPINIIEKEDTSLQKSEITEKEQYVPPLNFSLVEDSIYRSGFPMPINYPFLEQLKLKTIIYLGDLCDSLLDSSNTKLVNKGKPGKEKKKDKHGTLEIMKNYKKWIATTDIQFHHLYLESTQEPFNSTQLYQQTEVALKTALELILNKRNYPLLIHSNKGKHRVGLLVGLIRKLLQGWCLSGIFEEYEKFSIGKSEIDLECIEFMHPDIWYEEEWKPEFIRL